MTKVSSSAFSKRYVWVVAALFLVCGTVENAVIRPVVLAVDDQPDLVTVHKTATADVPSSRDDTSATQSDLGRYILQTMEAKDPVLFDPRVVVAELFRHLHGGGGGGSGGGNRRLDMTVVDRFGPGADWSCTTKGATDYKMCVDDIMGDEGHDDDNNKNYNNNNNEAAPAAPEEDTTNSGTENANEAEEPKEEVPKADDAAADTGDGGGRRMVQKRRARRGNSDIQSLGSSGRKLEDPAKQEPKEQQDPSQMSSEEQEVAKEKEEEEMLEEMLDEDEEIETLQGCAWCPLGESAGICLRATQGESVNHLNLLHFKCYPPGNLESKDDVNFWNEAMDCHALNFGDCFAGRGKCTWCKVKEPKMELCTSQSLWDEMVAAQGEVEGDKIRLDQVFHCSSEHDITEAQAGSLWDTKCSAKGGPLVSSEADKNNCLATLSEDELPCVVQDNPFPGFMGSTNGDHCMSQQQQRVIHWALDLFRELGWKEVSSGTEE